MASSSADTSASAAAADSAVASSDSGSDDMNVVVHDGDAEDMVMSYGGSKVTSSRNRSVRKRKGILPEEAADPPPACQESEQEGPFWFEAPRTILVTEPDTGRKKLQHRGITSRERQRLRELLKAGFISEDFLRTVVVPMNDETSDKARLRAHDHALTNWLKGRPLLKQICHEDGTVEISDISVDYERQLQRDHRQLLDAFRRGTYLFFELDGKYHYTTAGQLTYLQFGMNNDVHAYVEEHEEEIREQMKEAAKNKPAPAGDGRRRRRRELTKAPSKYSRGAVFDEYGIITDKPEEMAAALAAQKALYAKSLGTSAMAAAAACSATSAHDKARADAEAVHAALFGKTRQGQEAGEDARPSKRAKLDSALESLPAGAV